MCYHGSKVYDIVDLEEYYSFKGATHAFDKWQRFYHENSFDHHSTPVVVPETESLSSFSWGLIPWYTKTQEDAMKIRNQTCNAISEEMYDKPSFRDSAKEGKRCLIPMSGFFEWRWDDEKGKTKTPYHIFLRDQKIFSVAGIYSSWKMPDKEEYFYTYAVLTTKANKLMSEIHNNKKRMPVIIPREYEKDWLSSKLSKDDVLAMCQPFDDSKMDAYTISKLITSRKDPTNVPAVIEKFNYEKTTLF